MECFEKKERTQVAAIDALALLQEVQCTIENVAKLKRNEAWRHALADELLYVGPPWLPSLHPLGRTFNSILAPWFLERR